MFITWLLWGVAATAQNRVLDAREPLPGGRRRLMSCVPVIPLFPLALWGLAKIVDFAAPRWGTIAIGSLHAAFALILVASIVRDLLRLARRSRD